MADLSYLTDIDERLKGEDRARADFRNMLDVIRQAHDLAGGIAAQREELLAVRTEHTRLSALVTEVRAELDKLGRQVATEREKFNTDLERRRATTAAALDALEDQRATAQLALDAVRAEHQKFLATIGAR